MAWRPTAGSARVRLQLRTDELADTAAWELLATLAKELGHGDLGGRGSGMNAAAAWH